MLQLCLPLHAAEGELRLRVRGSADGVGFAAHREALVAAQHEVMREILRSKVASGDLRPFRSMIRKAEHYVTRVEELHIDNHEGETRVEVDAYVDMASVEQDLATLVLPRLPTPPTVSCLVAIETDGAVEVESPGTTEEALVKGLENLGLDARPHTAHDALFSASDFHDAVLGDLAASARYARETLADVVLIGVVTLERSESQEGGSAGRTRASLNLKVLRGNDGDLLDVFARSAAITGLDPESCREEVLGDVAAKVIGDVTVSTVLSVLSMQKQDEVLITLQNPGSRSRLAAFTDVFQREPLIDSISESFFSERLARIRLGYAGSLAYLVDQIDRQIFEGWRLEVNEVVGRDMTLSFISGE